MNIQTPRKYFDRPEKRTHGHKSSLTFFNEMSKNNGPLKNISVNSEEPTFKK